MNPNTFKHAAFGLFCLWTIQLHAQQPSVTISDANLEEKIDRMSLDQLKKRQSTIEADIGKLARFILRSDVGTIGFRSQNHDEANHLEWIEIDLGEESSIDDIVLVPTIWRASQEGFIADAFPEEFTIFAGKSGDRRGSVITSFTKKDHILPRVAPFSIPFKNVTASWIRLEATKLAPRSFDNKFIFQLAEVMVFRGPENLALGKPVASSSEWKVGKGAWDKQYLVDGFLPYLMDAAEGHQSVAMVSQIGIGKEPTIILDLEKSYALTQINLHAVEQSDTVPQTYAGDFGFPKQLMVEGANFADFSDARELLDFRPENIFGIGPIVMKRLNPMTCRYVRITATEPYFFEGYNNEGQEESGTRIGLAEIELLSDNRNVALGKPVQVSFDLAGENRSITALTDGSNLYGQILPLKDWMSQLSQRHELEKEKPLVEAELNQRYENQKTNLNRLSWGFAIFAAGSIILFLFNHTLKQRAIFRTRQRIAADLHDELGANLHAIALLSDLVGVAKDSPDKISKLIERIRELAHRTSESVKYCSNILETPGLYKDLIEAMRRNANRIMADLDHEFVFEGEAFVEKIKSNKRIDLILFYKECLVNIVRHSGATRAQTQLIVDHQKLELSISDNGCGFVAMAKNLAPDSLKRRARLLGAQMNASNAESGGAIITLTMRIT